MDTEPVDIGEYRRCLHDLAKVNTVTLTRRPILRWLERTLRQTGPGEPRLSGWTRNDFIAFKTQVALAAFIAQAVSLWRGRQRLLAEPCRDHPHLARRLALWTRLPVAALKRAEALP